LTILPNVSFADDDVDEVVVGRRGDRDIPKISIPADQGGSKGGGGSGGGAHRKPVKITEKERCEADADSVGKQCNNAYGDLNDICKLVNGYVGTLGGVFGKKLIEKIEKDLASEVYTTIKIGGGYTAFSADLVVPCSNLAAKAVSYCDTGVKKMKESCK
jgi:hypothetical protein